MLSRPATWPDYTASKRDDPQFNVRFTPERRAQIEALAGALNITGTMLARLVLISLVDGQEISADRLIEIAGSEPIETPIKAD